MRIAMWSGPRNLSTALMYSFGNRRDFRIMDEPFYAAYLAQSGLVHPMRDQILAAHETDPETVDQLCRGPGAPHLYMKHMPHHMLDGFPMGWAEDCVHVYLIRHPARVIASYLAKHETPALADIGVAQQWDLFQRLGGVVVDSSDILAAPDRMLRVLCAAVGIDFCSDMLSWAAGPRPEDGIWASHWYGAVHRSTGFTVENRPLPRLAGAGAELAAEALPFYNQLYKLRISGI